MRVHLAIKFPLRLGIVAGLALLAGCDQAPTAPELKADPVPSSIVITAGLSVYTDRSSWEAAVATAGGTVVNMDFAGLTLGRVTQLATNYGPFGIVVDLVSTNQFNNPGISIFSDASCSLGAGDCDVFTFNMRDPTWTGDMPVFNKLGFPQDVIAFGGDFIQTGFTAPDGVATGAVTLRIGTESVVINPYVDAAGNGFFGFVATADDTVTFTFAKSGTWVNEVFQVYNPAYANAPPVDPGSADEMIDDLQSSVAGMVLSGGVASSIDSKLRSAESALAADNTALACSALQDLLNHVKALRGKKLSVANADAITSAVSAIRDELDC
jgi:hypothetical protein